MPSEKPLVSIVMTSYNYKQYIGQAIESILNQTYDNWQLIISDDGSTDSSLEIIRSFSDKRITILTSRTNEGACAAYNKAYALCEGKYFSSLDSDDYIAPDKLEKQVEYLERHLEVGILGTFVTEVDTAGQLTVDKYGHEAWFNVELDLNQPDNWLWQNHLCHSSVLMHKSLHDRIGRFNNELSYTPDYEFWLRCFIGGAVFRVLPDKLVYYRHHDKNVTHQKPNRGFLEYTYIFHTLLKPYLLKINRLDLINQYMLLFLNCEFYKKADKNIKANLLESVLSSKNKSQSFKLFLDNIQHSVNADPLVIIKALDLVLSKHQQQQVWMAELEQGKTWLEEQRQKQQARIAELEQGKTWLEEQSAKQKQLATEREAWITELEQGKTWLEEQSAKQKQLATEREAWIAELEQGKTWLKEQLDKQKQLATEREAWIAELEQAKAWLEEQLDKQKQLATEREAWIAELAQAKVWLEEQWRQSRHIAAEQQAAISKLEHSLAKLKAHPIVKLAQRLGWTRS